MVTQKGALPVWPQNEVHIAFDPWYPYLKNDCGCKISFKALEDSQFTAGKFVPPLIALSGKKVLFWKWTLKLKSGWIGPQKQTVKIQVESSKEDGGIYQWWIGLCTVLLSIEVMSSVWEKNVSFLSAKLKFKKIKLFLNESEGLLFRLVKSNIQFDGKMCWWCVGCHFHLHR